MAFFNQIEPLQVFGDPLCKNPLWYVIQTPKLLEIALDSKVVIGVSRLFKDDPDFLSRYFGVLDHALPIDEHLPVIREEYAADYLDQGCFTRSVRAQQDAYSCVIG